MTSFTQRAPADRLAAIAAGVSCAGAARGNALQKIRQSETESRDRHQHFDRERVPAPAAESARLPMGIRPSGIASKNNQCSVAGAIFTSKNAIVSMPFRSSTKPDLPRDGPQLGDGLLCAIALLHRSRHGCRLAPAPAGPLVTKVCNLMADLAIVHAGVVAHCHRATGTDTTRPVTPGVRCRAFPIVVAQEAQSIPSTRRRSLAD